MYLPSYSTHGSQNIGPQKDMYTDVHNSCIHNKQNLKKTNRKIDKQIVVYHIIENTA